MKKSMLKVGFTTKKEAGVEQDQSSTPLYLNHIAAVIRALSRKGTAEAAQRRLAVISSFQVQASP